MSTIKNSHLVIERLRSLIRQIGAESTVLLKNDGNVLPLKAPSSIAIVGTGAGNSTKGPNGYVMSREEIFTHCAHFA